MIFITPQITINDNEIREEFIRASGPGGQNVNKAATAVQLYFDVRRSSLPPEVRARLLALARRRINADGALMIEAKRFRTQAQNREDARARLIALVRQAATPPQPRRKTKPTRAAKETRLQNKRRRGEIKKMRGVTLE